MTEKIIYIINGSKNNLRVWSKRRQYQHTKVLVIKQFLKTQKS